MRLLLLSVPVSSQRMTEEIAPPLGISYIASYLLHHGIDVELVDAYALKMEMKDLRVLFESKTPDVIGLSITIFQVNEGLEVARLVKRILPKTIVVVGGPHPSILPEQVLSSGMVDFVIIGEGEQTMLELMRALQSENEVNKIDGIVYKDAKGRIVRTPPRKFIENLDLLPFPAWEMLPIDKYKIPTMRCRPYVTIVASRGCPFNCIFCEVGEILGKRQRIRSPKNVLDEIEYLKREFGVKEVFIRDSLFTGNPSWAMEITEGILSRNLNITWQCESRVDLVRKEVLQNMKKSGCYAIWFGVESGNEGILRRARKGITLSKIRKAFKITRNVGLNIHAFFMLGLPGETKETIQQTIDFAIELDPDIASFNIATPLPGTEFYDIAKEEFLLTDDWETYSSKIYHGNTTSISYAPRGVTKEFLKKAYKVAHRRFYLRLSYILRRVGSVKSLHDIINLLRGLGTLIRYAG